jgi:hypothetical protein
MTLHATSATTEQIFVGRAVQHVRRAGFHLRAASFLLDDGGYSCSAIDDLAADTAGLLAEWSGRCRPPEMEAVPSHITAAAVEWRRHNRRRY